MKYVSSLSFKIIKNPVFEAFSLVVIVFNSIMLASDDPNKPPTSFSSTMDTVFLTLYSIEMGLKIIAYGFYFSKSAYIKDPWNVLDFVIVVSAYIPIILQGSSKINLSALRSLRVLRPLRAISSIQALKEILEALFSAIPPLQSVIVIILFFYTIFSIAGLQLFPGMLKKRCLTLDTGSPNKLMNSYLPYSYCITSSDCPKFCICGKTNTNIFMDQINFDTFGWSYLAIF